MLKTQVFTALVAGALGAGAVHVFSLHETPMGRDASRSSLPRRVAPRVTPSLPVPTLVEAEILARLSTDLGSEETLAELDRLERVVTRASESTLVKLLDSGSNRVFARAAMLLAIGSGEEAVPLLAPRLDSALYPRDVSLHLAIGRTRSASALKALLSSLHSGEFRFGAVDGLAEIPGSEATNALVSLVTGRHDHWPLAIRVLADRDDSTFALEELTDHDDAQVSAIALSTLAKRGDAAAFEELKVRASAATDEGSDHTYVDAIGEVGGSVAIAALVEVALAGRAVLSAVGALVGMSTRESAAAVHALIAGRPDLEAGILRGLMRTRSSAASSILLALLNQPPLDRALRVSAAATFAMQKSSEMDALHLGWLDMDAERATAAAAYFGHNGSAAATAWMRSKLNDASVGDQFDAALSWIGAHRGPDANATHEEAFARCSGVRRGAILRSIARNGSESPLLQRVLIEAIGSDAPLDPELEYIGRSLDVSDPRAVAALARRVAQDNHPEWVELLLMRSGPEGQRLTMDTAARDPFLSQMLAREIQTPEDGRRLFAKLMSSSDVEAHRSTFETLANNDLVVATQLERSSSPMLRASSLLSASRQRQPGRVEVFERFLEDPAPVVRAAALRALARSVPQPEALQYVETALRSGDTSNVDAAFDVLRQLGTGGAEMVVAIREDDSYPAYVREQAGHR